MGRAINSEVFTIEFGALPKDTPHFYVASFEGTEALNSLFEFKIAILCRDDDIDTRSLIGTRAKFTIRRAEGEDAVFCGYASNIEQQGRIRDYNYYLVTLSPSFGKLRFIVDSAVYLEKDLKETIESILGKDKFFAVEHEFRFSDKYPKKEFAMQFEENSFDYIKWRLEEQGAYFYFDSTGERVIFTDNPILHDSSKGTVFYSPCTGLEINVADEVIQSFELTRTTLPSRVVVRTYDWKNPNEPLVGIAEVSPKGSGDVYLTKEEADSRGEAERIARIRAEQILAGSRIFTGCGSVPFFRPGVVFTLAMHKKEKFNRDYIITKIKHEGRQETLLNFVCKIPIDCGDNNLSYRNTFECIESDMKYRSARTISRESVYGAIHAFIDGDSSGNLLIDKFGRYKVLFPFDISGRCDGKASYWVRRAQEQVGKDCGLAFPLSAGTEVLISFVDGNPNQPIITGALANGETGSLSGSGNSDASGIRTAGGAQLTFNNKKNLIQLSNLAGGELMFGSGSEDYMRTKTHYSLQGTAVGASSISGALYDNICGFISRGYAECDNLKLYAMRGGAVLGKIAQKIFNSVSGENADSNIPSSDWGDSLTKIIPLLRSILDYTPYNALISAETKNSYSTLQCFPSNTELTRNFIAMGGGRLTSTITDTGDTITGALGYEEYPKKSAIAPKVWTQITSCLPELAVIILTQNWRKKMSEKNIGGIMIDAKDKNLNLHAKSYIGFHAERGIFLNTRQTDPEFLSDWGAPQSFDGWEKNDIRKIFSRIPDSKKFFIDIQEGSGSKIPLQDILDNGHANILGGGEDMGRGVEDQPVTTFIAADTDLYLKKNDFHIQKQEKSASSYAGWYTFKTSPFQLDTWLETHLSLLGGNIQLGSYQEPIKISVECKEDDAAAVEPTMFMFNHEFSSFGITREYKERVTDINLLKVYEDTISVVTNIHEGNGNDYRHELLLGQKRDGEDDRFGVTLCSANRKDEKQISYLRLSEEHAELKANEVAIGGIVISGGKIKAAKGKCLVFAKGKIKIMLPSDMNKFMEVKQDSFMLKKSAKKTG